MEIIRIAAIANPAYRIPHAKSVVVILMIQIKNVRAAIPLGLNMDKSSNVRQVIWSVRGKNAGNALSLTVANGMLTTRQNVV